MSEDNTIYVTVSYNEPKDCSARGLWVSAHEGVYPRATREESMTPFSSHVSGDMGALERVTRLFREHGSSGKTYELEVTDGAKVALREATVRALEHITEVQNEIADRRESA
jgi:hypothetical protein